MSPQRGQKQSPEIAEALRFIFEDSGASPTELAREWGTSRQAIYHWWKNGHEPSWAYGQKILATARSLRRK